MVDSIFDPERVDLKLDEFNAEDEKEVWQQSDFAPWATRFFFKGKFASSFFREMAIFGQLFLGSS